MHFPIFSIVILLFTLNSFAQDRDILNAKANEALLKNDTKTAFPFLKQAAEAGHPEAQYNLGYSYQKGIEVPQNDSIANVWFIRSAKQGYTNAQFKIAYSYAVGRGVKQDYNQAFYWALQCAKQNDPECMFNVVSCYQQGMGTEKNTDSMLVWAVRLGLLENPEDLKLSSKITSARLNLALLYKDGTSVPVDLVKSYQWFLIYNESKIDFSILQQQAQINTIKELEKRLTLSDRVKAKEAAEKMLHRNLRNFDNLYKQDI